MKNYGTDPRDKTQHIHSMPQLGDVFVRAVGANTFRFCYVREMEYIQNADGKITGWTAYVGGNANSAIEAITPAWQWKWTDWHSLKDDDIVRSHLDNAEAATRALDAKAAAEREAEMAAANAPTVDAAPDATPDADVPVPAPRAKRTAAPQA